MSDYDPNRFRKMEDLNSQMQPYSDSNTPWGWIAGIAAVIIVVLVALGMGRDGSKTADSTARQSTTTGQANPRAENPATTGQTRPAQRTQPSTTGQSSQ